MKCNHCKLDDNALDQIRGGQEISPAPSSGMLSCPDKFYSVHTECPHTDTEKSFYDCEGCPLNKTQEPANQGNPAPQN